MGSSASSEFDIRIARPDDAAACAEIYGPFAERTAVSFEEEAPTVEEMRERIVRTLLSTPWLTAASGGEVAGYAYASKHRDRAAYRWSVDVSAYVHERFRGRGVGRRLYERLFQILREQGFRNAYAGIALPNDASIALHRAAGFELVGTYQRVGWKLGAWHDVAWYGLQLGGEGAADAPSEPIPFSSLDSPDAGRRWHHPE